VKRKATRLERKDRILRHASVKMELPHLIKAGSAPGCVCKQVQYVCSDMWKAYLNVIAEKLGQAVHVLES
jgi:hypothetical protein